MRRSVVLLFLLPACSLSNAFLGFPDFQQVENETACREFNLAFEEELSRCQQQEFFLPIDALCQRLNDRDPKCAALFQCRQESLACVDGTAQSDPACEEQFLNLRCNDPFEDIPVDMPFTIELVGAASCEEAGVLEIGVNFSDASGNGGFAIASLNDGAEESRCAIDGRYRFGVPLSSFPLAMQVVGLDRDVDGSTFNNPQTVFQGPSLQFTLEEVTVEETFVDEVTGEVFKVGTLDLGVQVLTPVP